MKRLTALLLRLGIGLGIGLVVVVLTHVLDIGFLKDIEFLTIDYRFQQRGVTRDLAREGNVVIVKISDEDVKALPEKFPFPRSYYAHVIENLNRAGARAVAIDLTFDSPGRGDDTLRAVLRNPRYGNVVLGVKATGEESTARYELRSLERTYNTIFYEPGRRVGVVNVLFDRDNVVRRYLPKITIGDYPTPTLGFAALNAYFKAPSDYTAKVEETSFVYGKIPVPKYDDVTFLLNYYGPVETFRYEPFANVINDETFWTKDELEIGESLDTFDENMMRIFKDKIVLIGSTMAEERDIHTTPMVNPRDGARTMHGVEIHATAIQNILDGSFVHAADPLLEIGLILVLSALTFAGIVTLKQVKVRYVAVLEVGSVLIIAAVMLGIAELAVVAFTTNSVMMSIIHPALAVVLAYVGTIVYQYLAERQQKAMIKGVFSHYINPSVVNELISDPEKAKLGGDRRELTVFFSDIAGFTSISESLPPEQLVLLLNDYLEEMTKIIFKYEGTLDKYEGDAVMAFWGAPIRQDDHALRTCLAALEMQKRLEVLRPRWVKEGKPEIAIRIGINTGTMIVGNMGGQDRFDYTVIGDSVNLASRLEGANKQYGSKIMISEFTHKHVAKKVVVRELDLIQVKGKNEPVRVYELLGLSTMPLTEEQKQSHELYHEGLKLYRNRNWAEAIAYMEQAMKLDPTCRVAQIYIERSNLYQIAPPPDDWNGVFVMTTK
jgi:adenylate cyclase